MLHRSISLILLLLVGCQTATEQPLAATTVPSPTQVVLRTTPIPTANPLPSRTPTLPPTITFTPSPTLTVTPSPTITPSPTATLSPTPSPIPPTGTPIPSPTSSGPVVDPNFTPPPTWTPPPANPATQIADHFAFTRPIPNGGVNWVDRIYPYGATAGGTFSTHHGVEFVNPTGTPIIAAGDGVVYYVGDDSGTQFGPTTNFYGNLVVLQHPISDAGGQPVYTLYGHMNSLAVQMGQSVARGDRLGTVGASGIALGPHLHFEVRVGSPTDYGATRNPELWIRPYPNFGTLAGVAMDADGNRLYDVTIQVESTDIRRYTWSYHDNAVNPDDVFNENFVLGDLPANYYEVTVSENGRVRFRQIVYVYPNRTTWLEVRLNR
ncbi:MAG: peptidoglycan DD-metalloendopeptidase family protein [Chloroflexota bacterium]|nr:peptidoglycan DD-metalloendopeptidase family protein [Chloroflexota bacterium]